MFSVFVKFSFSFLFLVFPWYIYVLLLYDIQPFFFFFFNLNNIVFSSSTFLFNHITNGLCFNIHHGIRRLQITFTPVGNHYLLIFFYIFFSFICLLCFSVSFFFFLLSPSHPSLAHSFIVYHGRHSKQFRQQNPWPYSRSSFTLLPSSEWFSAFIGSDSLQWYWIQRLETICYNHSFIQE